MMRDSSDGPERYIRQGPFYTWLEAGDETVTESEMELFGSLRTGSLKSTPFALHGKPGPLVRPRLGVCHIAYQH
jgi:hypothetical protein